MQVIDASSGIDTLQGISVYFHPSLSKSYAAKLGSNP